MSGEHESVILDTVASLNKGCHKISYLRQGGNYHSRRKNDDVHPQLQGMVLYICHNYGKYHGTNSGEGHTTETSLDGLLGTDLGNELMTSEANSHKISKNIADPREEHCNKVEILTEKALSEKNQGTKGRAHVKHAAERCKKLVHRDLPL